MANTETRKPTNVPDGTILLHISELSALERELEKLDAEKKAAQARCTAHKKKIKGYRATIENDGIALDHLDKARAYMERDEEALRDEMVGVGRILMAVKSPMGHQFDLFEDPTAPLEEKWEYQGYLAGARGAGDDENPHKRGDKGHDIWERGRRGAQAAIAAAMSAKEDEAANAAKEAEAAAAKKASKKKPKGNSQKADTHYDDAGVTLGDDGEPVDEAEDSERLDVDTAPPATEDGELTVQ